MKIVEKKFRKPRVLGRAEKVKGKPIVAIDPRQPDEERLDTIIHEFLHHLLPQWTEEAITKSADELSDMVLSDGWVRPEK